MLLPPPLNLPFERFLPTKLTSPPPLSNRPLWQILWTIGPTGKLATSFHLRQFRTRLLSYLDGPIYLPVSQRTIWIQQVIAALLCQKIYEAASNSVEYLKWVIVFRM